MERSLFVPRLRDLGKRRRAFESLGSFFLRGDPLSHRQSSSSRHEETSASITRGQTEQRGVGAGGRAFFFFCSAKAAASAAVAEKKNTKLLPLVATHTGEGLVVLLPLGDGELVLFEQARGSRKGERGDGIEGGASGLVVLSFFFRSACLSLSLFLSLLLSIVSPSCVGDPL